MDLSYYKIIIKQDFYRFRCHLSKTNKKGKFLIFSFVFIGILNFIIFNYEGFVNFLEYTESYFAKTYVSLPIAILLTWLIAYFFYRKNKPMQDFWNTKRQETIEDVIIYTRQSASSIRQVEELAHQGKSFPTGLVNSLTQNDLLALQQITNINYNYLTHKEVRKLGMYIRSVANYFGFLSKSSHSQIEIDNLETDILTAEHMIVDLLISFKITDKITIDALTKPLSIYYANDIIIQHRKIDKNRIQNILLV